MTVETLETQLETLVDRFGLAEVLAQLSTICDLKAEHVAHSWQDEGLARLWERAGSLVERTATSRTVRSLSF